MMRENRKKLDFGLLNDLLRRGIYHRNLIASYKVLSLSAQAERSKMQDFIYKPGDIVTYRASDQINVDALAVVTKAHGMTIDVLRKDGAVQKVHRNRLKPIGINIEEELHELTAAIRKARGYETNNS